MLLPRDLTHKTSPLTLDRPLFSRRCDCPHVPLNPISTRASPSPAFNCLNSISHQTLVLVIAVPTLVASTSSLSSPSSLSCSRRKGLHRCWPASLQILQASP
ncbi:hypothetical protein FJTKL_00290 [Diaporthe vaccinii]|uniref:Uncharacterized protein n=1 Tax=Diaporthe vaccinii TaxID=105482 RepID=A0ABR4E3H7_9PEZI